MTQRRIEVTLNESSFRTEQSARHARATITARASRSSIAAAVLAISMTLATGCATDAGSPETGQLVLPLTQLGSHGELYHLANATFDITGASGLTTVDGGGNQSQVTATLPPGLFWITLRDGWRLEKSIDGGATYAPVSALLGTPNPNAFRVLANQPIIVDFDFLIRNINGTLMIRLGVVTQPRELAGGMVISQATDGLASYAAPENRALDFAIYYTLATFESETLPDGTKQHNYLAGTIGVLGPKAPLETPLAAEFYNDRLGLLAGSVAPDLTAGFLQYTVAAKPDGTTALSGFIAGGFTEIDFQPSPIDTLTMPTIGADGFPNDEFFYDSGVPFTLTSSLGTMSGTLRMRHLVP
jgi:hypothetical protein